MIFGTVRAQGARRSGVSAAIFCLACSSAGGATFTTIDPPGSVATQVFGINDAGTVSGTYSDTNTAHGFFLTPGGTVTTFDVKGALTTFGAGINGEDAVPGFWYDATTKTNRGFLRTPRGKIKTFDPEGSVQTDPRVVNDKGVVAGDYDDSGYDSHGFVRRTDGTIISFDPSGGIQTRVTGINDGGTVVGSSNGYGFTRSSTGKIKRFQVFESSTSAFGINGDGDVTGSYSDSHTGYDHGYIRAADGTVTSFDVSDDGSSSTDPEVINASGVIAGVYTDSQYAQHGFVRSAAGKIKVFDAPNAAGIGITGINTNGAIAGWYLDNNSVWHGFLRTP